MPISVKNISFSSSSKPAISASIAAHTATTGEFSLAAYSCTACKCGLFSKPCSKIFATYIVGFAVMKQYGLSSANSSASKFALRMALASLSTGRIFSKTATNLIASLSPARAIFCWRNRAFSAVPKSAKANSVLMTSISEIGSTLPATCTTFSSSKQRTTCAIASVSRILARN